MGRRIELPQLPKGQTQEQLQALYSYLYRMAEALNNNLAEIGNGDFTDEEMVTVREITGETGSGEGMAEAETLKSLIIKTAQLIKSEIDAYNMKLVGTYEADGKLGRYVRKTRLDVDVTPTGITQNYTFESIVQGLKTYEVNAKNYIKTGLLRTVSDVPVYGVAIGKDVVTFSDDGTETYNDGNKVAELTADELSFWQNGNKIAVYSGTQISLYSANKKRVTIDDAGVKIWNGSTILSEFLGSALKFYYNGTLRTQMDTDGVKIYKGTALLMKITGERIGFYYNGTETFYILNGKMYAAGDMEIQSGKTFKIVSGGVIDVDTNNVKIDSANQKMVVDKFTFESDGIKYTDNGKNIRFGKYGTIDANTMAAVLAELDASQNGRIRILSSPVNSNTNSEIIIECLKADYNQNVPIRRMRFKGAGTGIATLGCEGADSMSGFSYAQISNVIGNKLVNGDVTGGSFRIILDPAYNPVTTNGISSTLPAIEISHFPTAYNGALRVTYQNPDDESHVIHFENNIYSKDVEGQTVRYTYLVQNSSREIKHDIRDMEPRGEALDRLRPVTFVYDEDPGETVRAGLIYEEAAEVLPEICTGDESSKAINYVELIPMLLKEIQELRARVKDLEEREGGQ